MMAQRCSVVHIAATSRPPVPQIGTSLGAPGSVLRPSAPLLGRRPNSKVVRRSQMFDGDGEDDSGGGVATLDAEESSRPSGEEYRREYPNKKFVAETLEAFPEAGVADVEQARVLFSDGGYTYLDVRSALENEDLGKVRNSVNIPMVNSVRKYNAKEKKKVVKSTKNKKWMADIKKRFPKKDAKLLIGCSNGTKYSMDALMALDEEGYENIVGLKGGFYAWFSVFDNKLSRRKTGEYAETFTHDGDSCGIHSSGAGFDKVDKADKWVPPDY